jgi:predicted anti-sigma-YlaC factor YlaD
MGFETNTKNKICPREEISLYLDGELSSKDEMLLEHHLANCSVCFDELNSQKKMLSALSFAFAKPQELELPKDFTKVVVTKAESGVKGLRCRKERIQALFLCSFLFLILTIGFGAESDKIFSVLNNFGSRIITLGGFLGHLTFDISIGIAVVLRSLSHKILYSSAFIMLFCGFALTLFLLVLPRFIHKLSRVKAS